MDDFIQSERALGAPTLLPETHLLGEIGPRLGVVRRNHGIVGRKAPFFPVFVRRHIVLGAQVPLQRLELAPVLEADKEIIGNGFLGRNRWLRRLDVGATTPEVTRNNAE